MSCHHWTAASENTKRFCAAMNLRRLRKLIYGPHDDDEQATPMIDDKPNIRGI
jgi:hypothetical protein